MRGFTKAACTAFFAAAGTWIGREVHGGEPRTFLATAAGAFGGFGIAGAAWQVRGLWNASRRAHPGGPVESPAP